LGPSICGVKANKLTASSLKFKLKLAFGGGGVLFEKKLRKNPPI